VLIAGAELEGRAPVDARLAGGRVVEIGRDLAARPGERVLEAGGGALLPGLHDHHLHLLALAAARDSLDCGPPQVQDRAALARALRAPRSGRGWLRGVGYHESVAGPLDRFALDAWLPDAPLRLQHRSGALWMLNSAGVERLGLDRGVDAPGVERGPDGRATGRLFRLDAWLRERLGSAPPPSLAAVGRELASYGVTGVTDCGADNAGPELALLASAVCRGELPQRVLLMGGEALPEPPASQAARIARGALKLMLVEAQLPEPAALEGRIAAAHAVGRPVAVHCVTRAELVFALAAFAAAGARAGDRIEHAAVAPPELLAPLAALGLCVVTQPHFVFERGDAYAADVEPRDHPWLYRARALLEAGVPLGGGSDAPFGDSDPWCAMRAAVERRSRGGLALGPDEALTPERALALFTTSAQAPGGPPRRVDVGAPADLCLLDAPWAVARRELASRGVRATWCAGRQVHEREPA